MKWLFRTICATEAYQRESRPRRDVDGTPFVANVAQPLRSDQLYNALLTAADAEEGNEMHNRRGRRRPQMMGATVELRRSASQFEAAFGYDPSDPRETVTSSIPQALAMMNGAADQPGVARHRPTRRCSADCSARFDENEPLVEELYLRTLSREPTDKEMQNGDRVLSARRENRSAAF